MTPERDRALQLALRLAGPGISKTTVAVGLAYLRDNLRQRRMEMRWQTQTRLQ